jgi:arginyl-tRNA synthetase
MDFRSQIAQLLSATGIAGAEKLLEVPPDLTLGDFALPCFGFAKEQKKAPAVIAQQLASSLQAPFLEKVVASGPYVNFFLRPASRAVAIIAAVSDGSLWQKSASGKNILIEYPSPNTNKPLHLGHVRNMVLGTTLAILAKANGNSVVQVNLNNDRGVHICKSMLAYDRWGEGRDPDKKSDHFVGDFYVLFEKKKQEDPALEEQAQQMLVAWEQNDPHVRALWEKMNGWALSGFHETYKRYNVSFDKEYFESEIYQEGKAIVLANKDKFVQDESGAIIAPLESFKLPDKVLLRKDGTSIYMTQDIALTTQKIKDFNPDLQIWVVGNEQNMHFQQLFAIMELIGVGKRDTFFHLSYGMVALPEGRMKSREGRVIDADDILDELEAGAAQEIRSHHADWPAERIAATSKVIALGALRFFMLKFDPAKDFTFNPQSSLSFEGDTGPYLQYTHARIASVLRKADWPSEVDVSVLTAPEEQELLRQLSFVGDAFSKAASEYKPNVLAAQLLEVGRAFNSFYHACPVLAAEPAVRDARLYLLGAVQQVLSHGLSLLGIDSPSEM